MPKFQAIIVALLGATFLMLGIEGDSPLHQAMLVASGVYLCAAFAI